MGFRQQLLQRDKGGAVTVDLSHAASAQRRCLDAGFTNVGFQQQRLQRGKGGAVTVDLSHAASA